MLVKLFNLDGKATYIWDFGRANPEQITICTDYLHLINCDQTQPVASVGTGEHNARVVGKLTKSSFKAAIATTQHQLDRSLFYLGVLLRGVLLRYLALAS
ncbi:hypothetical protein Pse7367_2486 [Thalassoporum mexicanum PCC 7367]|nr:hypothetical protein Pse7367_2486 [Pseudanabaena sp. PCC 7367]